MFGKKKPEQGNLPPPAPGPNPQNKGPIGNVPPPPKKDTTFVPPVLDNKPPLPGGLPPKPGDIPPAPIPKNNIPSPFDAKPSLPGDKPPMPSLGDKPKEGEKKPDELDKIPGLNDKSIVPGASSPDIHKAPDKSFDFGNLKIPEPPSNMKPPAPEGENKDGAKKEVSAHEDYDFSLPEINLPDKDEMILDNNLGHDDIAKKEKIEATQSEEKLKDEKVKLRTFSQHDRFTDNEEMGVVEKRLRTHRVAGGPIFIEIINYKHVLDGIDFMKIRLKESGDYIFKIEDYNEKKHSEFEQWKSILEDIQRKLVFVDKTLFEKRAR